MGCFEGWGGRCSVLDDGLRGNGVRPTLTFFFESEFALLVVVLVLSTTTILTALFVVCQVCSRS